MSRIDPSGIPGAALDLESVRAAGGALGADGTTIRDGGAAVVADWQRLPASFEATGTEVLYDAMAPVGVQTASIGHGLAGIAAALQRYADQVEPIKARLDALRSQAHDFVRRTDAFQPKIESIATGYTLGLALPERVDHWDEDPDLNDENNALIRQVADAEADWLDAQQRCATAIRAAVGLGAKGAADERAMAAQLRSDDLGKTPWGAPSDRKESCSEKAITFQNHVLWDGVVVGFGWNTLKAVGSLVGIDPTGRSESETWDGLWRGLSSGDWSGYWRGQGHALESLRDSWLGVAHLVSGLAVDPMRADQFLGSPLADWMPADVRQGLVDWNRQDGTVVYGTEAALVGLTLPAKWWDPKAYQGYNPAQHWVDNPGGTFGTSATTILSFFIPGAGEARAAGVAGDAARIAEGARFADVLADGSVTALRGLSADALRATIRGLSDADAARLAAELAKPELDAGALSALKLDDLRVEAPADAAPPPPSAPESGLDRAPGRDEPVNGAAGDEHPGTAVGSSAGDDPVEPVHPEDSPAGDGPADPPPPRDGSQPEPPERDWPYDRLQAGDAGAAQHIPVLDARVAPGDGGPGWTRLPDTPVDPTATPHGEVLPEHGELRPLGDPVPRTADLRMDGEAPWGRLADGTAMTREQWVERFLEPDSFHLPGNTGAVAGTRAQITDLQVYLRDFGEQMDRIGPERGTYLSPMIDHTPFTFEGRALPPPSLGGAYRSYLIEMDRLPDGWSIEVSRVAPAYGMPGGGIQALVLRDGEAMSVDELLEAGFLG